MKDHEPAPEAWHIPLIVRGEVLDGAPIGFGFEGRAGTSVFAPDLHPYLDRLPLTDSTLLSDLGALRFAEIEEYLDALGRRLHPERNRHLQEAFAVCERVSALPPTVLRRQYELLPELFRREHVHRVAARAIGIEYLDGWVEHEALDPGSGPVSVRAVGARALHIIAGNVPQIGAATIVHNAICRSDAIVKLPSNDPLTAAAIGRTMIEMAPTHPLTRHLSVAYWKGGDPVVASALFRPTAVDKIIAWGGVGAIHHVVHSLQPGIDLIALEPKSGRAIIGREALDDMRTSRLAAAALASDVGALNQEACFSTRVAFLESGTGREGLARARRFAELTLEAIDELPSHVSAPQQCADPLLREQLIAARLARDDLIVIGGTGCEGGVIVSGSPHPVDFAEALSGRVVNIVPVDDLDIAIRSMCSTTQTVAVYPAALQARLRDQLALHGVQRVVTLGGAARPQSAATPQDGLELLRRMCRWVVSESAPQREPRRSDVERCNAAA